MQVLRSGHLNAGGGGGGGVEWNNIGPGGLNKIGACPGGICKSVGWGGGGGGGVCGNII